MQNIQAYLGRFKPCRRKQFEAWFCKVPTGNCILDKIKDAKAISLLRGRTYLSNVEVSELQRKQPEIYKLIQSNIVKATDFVLNIDGSLSLVTFAELVRDYTYADKTLITKESILNKAYICEWYLSQLTPVKITYSQAIKSGKTNAEENFVLRWQKIVYRGNLTEIALSCVEDIKDNFRVYLPDPNEQYFIILPLVNNQPVIQSGRFITGRQFAYMYDMRGWSISVEEGMQTQGTVPKELFELSSPANHKESFTTMIYDFLQKSYHGSFAENAGIIKDLVIVKLADFCLSIKYTQCYEEMPVNYLIYTRSNEYFITQGNIDEKFPEGLKGYLSSLEKKEKIVIRLSDLQKFKEILVAILGFTPVANVSNFFIPRLSVNEFESLKSYSGSEYYKINKYLRGEECDNPFEAYLQATFISDVIDRTMISRNMYHFRGLALPNSIANKITEGYVLENKCFASTALISPVAISFALAHDAGTEQGVVLVFKNSFRQHGVYINNFSVHKGTEFEVLYNIGYDFKFIKQLGHFSDEYGKCAVWICEIIENQDRGIRKYAYKKDATEKLVYMLQSDGRLMRDFYIQNVKESDKSCRITLKRYNMENYLIRICLEGDEFIVTFEGEINEELVFSIKEKGYQFLFQYIYHVLSQDTNFKPRVSVANLGSFSERFMQDLCNYFIGNNFIISNQDVNKEWRDEVKIVSSFSILDSDLQPLNFEVVIMKEKEYLRLELEADGRKKIFRKEFDKRFELFEEVYWSIVCKFDLDSTRRLKRIFATLGGFHECEIEFIKQDRGTYKCYMQDKVFDIVMSGTSMLVSLNGNSIELNYYDDIYEAAANIKTLM